MSDQSELVTPYDRRQAVRNERTSALRRQFLAAVEEHSLDNKILCWMLGQLSTSEEIANLAQAYVHWGQFTQRQWRFLRARYEGRSTAT